MVTAVHRLSNTRAILIGDDWNATVTGSPSGLDYLADSAPGVIIDVHPTLSKDTPHG